MPTSFTLRRELSHAFVVIAACALRSAAFSDRLRPPMLNRAKRFVLLLALVVFPAQGIAAAISDNLCHASGEQHVSHIAHANDGHDHGVQRNSHPDEDGPLAQFEHFSCQPMVSLLPDVTPLSSGRQLSVWVSWLHGLSDLFVPDRPRRPPLA